MRIESTELLPRHSFLLPLIRGARVLELGALDRTSGETAELLHDQGAASVVSLGSAAAVERARRERGGPGLSFRTAPLASVQEAAFDLVLVHELGLALAEGAPALLARLLAPGGHLVVAVPAGGPSLLPRSDAGRYREALAALRPAFPSIEVATQQALVGWLLAPAGAEAPALRIDPAFAGVETPGFHLLICGATAAGLVEQALVPLPASPVLSAWGAEGAGGVLARERARAENLVEELRGAREKIAERESWIEGLRHEVEQRHQTAEAEAAELHLAQLRLAKLEREHGAASEALKRVREQLVARSRELEGARRAVDARTEDLRLAEEELENARGAASRIERERQELAQRLEEAEAAAARAQARLASLEESHGQVQAELEALRAVAGGVLEVRREQAGALAELEALRAGGPEGARASDRDPWRERRELEEQLGAAQRRIREAEERMRAAERRADEADAARAEALASARRWQLEAETARREAAGVAAGMADREALRLERDEALARAAEEAGRRAAARAQLQGEVARAAAAESLVAQLRAELERLRPAAAEGTLPSSRQA